MAEVARASAAAGVRAEELHLVEVIADA